MAGRDGRANHRTRECRGGPSAVPCRGSRPHQIPKFRENAADLGQPGCLAGNLHEGLRTKNSRHQGGLRRGGGADRVRHCAVADLLRPRPRHDLPCRSRPGRFVPDQPDAHQCSSGDGPDVGAGRQNARAVVDDRRHGQGIHLRQAGRHFLQHEGADRHSARAGRLRACTPGPGLRTRSARFACT